MSSGAPQLLAQTSASYWEQRAQLFAARGEGLAAVCSYGMPEFYNRTIQRTQRLALSSHLEVAPGMRVLDVGCGVGRWSRLCALRGAEVSGIDLSPSMVRIAQRRAVAEGVADRCRFIVQDLAELELPNRFDLILGVTVLQHILEPARLRAAVQRMARHLQPRGRMLLLEAAPSRRTRRCDSAIFTARHRRTYLDLFEECGLRVREVHGIDPAPFRRWALPYLRHLPRTLHWSASALVSALSLPVDLMFARYAIRQSWHALFVLEHTGAPDEN
jgi:2-polyprenyl-3-methyl-5-hydroxy-6-metoxy-1,4-benzoquinol methylase